MTSVNPEWHKFEPGVILNGAPGRFRILEEKRIGDNGISYIGCSVLEGDRDGEKVFIKTPKLTKRQMSQESYIKLELVKLLFGFSQEAKNSERLQFIKGAVKVISNGFQTVTVDGFPFPFPFIVHEFIGGEELTDYLTRSACSTNGKFCGIPTAARWFDFSTKLIQILKDLHNQLIAHGNISPGNIRVVDDEPVIVDFGEAFLVDVESRKPNVKKVKDPYAAPERSSETHWSFPADIYSIGGVFYFLATGQTPPAMTGKAAHGSTSESHTLALKEAVYEQIKHANPRLLEENPAIARIIDKCLRDAPTDRYSYPENILSHIEIFDNEKSTSIGHFSEYAPKLIQDIANDIKALATQENEHVQFCRILTPELLLLQKHIKGMNKGTHEIIGDREDLIDSLLRYLSLLKKDDQYYTLTIPSFWSHSNLGINGRFLTMNMLMARRGVAIRRVFLLTKSEIQNVNKLLFQAHQKAGEEFQIRVARDAKGIPVNESEGFYTGFCEVDDEERNNVVDMAGTTGLLRFVSGRYIAFNFAMKPDSEAIGKIRFWSPTDANVNLNTIKNYLSASNPIQDLLSPDKDLRSEI